MRKKLIFIALIVFLVSVIFVYSADDTVVSFFTDTEKNDFNLTLSERERFSVRFHASNSFDKLDIFFVSVKGSSKVKVSLYRWEGKLPEGQEALESREFSSLNKSYASFDFNEKEKGEYLLEVEVVAGTAILRKSQYKRSQVDLYRNGYVEGGSIDVKLYYTSKPEKDLEQLSSFHPPKHTPMPEPEYKMDEFAERIKPDTWTGVDGLGRTLPLYSNIKKGKNDRIVGIFYWTWHGELSKASRARNITEIIKKYPEAINDFKHRAWEGYSGYHHWNEPLFGYYSTNDEYVLRKHAEMLADAGIDFIAFDCTNGSYTWTESYMTLLKVFSEAKKDGVRVPKITFMSNFAPIDATWNLVKQLYKELYRPGLYNDLWFYWEGKPLMWAYPHTIPEYDDMGSEILEFFTFRYPYAEGIWPLDENYSWGWSGYYPNKGYVKKNGVYEQMPISIAINHGGPMNNPDAWGRAFSHSGYESSYTYGGKTTLVHSKMENAIKYGIFIQEQWDYVIEENPKIVFVTGWNEWVAIRHEEWGGYENAFPDQFNDEFSRDIEPSNGELKDNYYYQLVANVRRFKGVSRPDTYKRKNTIDIFGDIRQWDNVEAVFNHYTNNTKKRDHAGYIGTYYKSDTMRNDIKSSKVAFDDEYIYFYVETVNALTDKNDEAWMRLFIDVDFTGVTPNWEGFEFVVNRTSPQDKCYVERSIGGWNWEKVFEADYSIKDNVLQIAIPRKVIYQNEDIPSFSFKWADNNCVDGDIYSFYTDGDCAPGGRFCFALNIGNVENSFILAAIMISVMIALVLIKVIVYKFKTRW